ncbi:MAG: AMP-binding protein, partial [Blastocatellia bacterium]
MHTQIHTSSATCFLRLFAAQVALRPDHPAIIDRLGQLTYAELDARANQLAHYLRGLGAGPETLIPVCVDRTAAMAIGILGVLKAGAAYVPVDPDYPAARIALMLADMMLADAAAPLLVTQAALATRLPHTGARLVRLDTDQAALAAQPLTEPVSQGGPDNLAYVIYTSGSTGRPRGTMLTRANLWHYVTALQNELRIGPEDRYLHLASLAFSSSRRHLFFPLAHGATVVLADEEQRLDALATWRLVKEQSVTVFDAVPSWQRHCLNTLRDLPAAARADLLDNHVRLILSASEPLLSDVPRAWMHEFRHPARHVHMFGQTETSGIVTLHHLTEADCDEVRVVPAGRPLARTEVYLLDEQQRTVPDGQPGEIYVRGAGVGRGYLHQPELTAERFITNGEWGMRNGESGWNGEFGMRNGESEWNGEFGMRNGESGENGEWGMRNSESG